MAWGTSYQDVYVEMTLTDAYEACQLAAVRTGKLIVSFSATSTMIVHVRVILLNEVQISLHPVQGGTTIKIRGHGNTIWAGGAKKVTYRFVHELNGVLSDSQP